MKAHARVLPLPGAPVTWTAVLFAAREKEETPSRAAKCPSAPHMVSLKRIRKLGPTARAKVATRVLGSIASSAGCAGILRALGFQAAWDWWGAPPVWQAG